MRWALGVEYEGSAYHGWQAQSNMPSKTIQQTLEAAIAQIVNHPVQVTCAGRTDRGVHALAQVVHFDTGVSRRESAFVAGINRYLPADIRVQWATPVAETFHARFTALSRSYLYVLYNHHAQPAIFRQQVTWFPYALNVDAMAAAAEFLVGEQDFSSFRAADCQSKTVHRCVRQLQVRRTGDFVTVAITANAFLHHMVRNIVGVLLDIGTGKRTPEWAHTVLLAKDRRQAGITAPPQGLYLTVVEYPSAWQFPANTSSNLQSLFNMVSYHPVPA